MEITDIRIKKVNASGKLKAYVTVTFDDCFVIHNLKIIAGQAGIFVAMPSRKTKMGEYKDIAHPINSDFRKIIQTKILEEFDEMEEEPEQEPEPEQGLEQEPEPEQGLEPEQEPEPEQEVE